MTPPVEVRTLAEAVDTALTAALTNEEQHAAEMAVTRAQEAGGVSRSALSAIVNAVLAERIRALAPRLAWAEPTEAEVEVAALAMHRAAGGDPTKWGAYASTRDYWRDKARAALAAFVEGRR